MNREEMLSALKTAVADLERGVAVFPGTMLHDDLKQALALVTSELLSKPLDGAKHYGDPGDMSYPSGWLEERGWVRVKDGTGHYWVKNGAYIQEGECPEGRCWFWSDGSGLRGGRVATAHEAAVFASASTELADNASDDKLGEGWEWEQLDQRWHHVSGAVVRRWHIGAQGWMWWRATEEVIPSGRKPVPTAREAAALALSEPDAAPAKCTHDDIGLPGCETCDPSTDRNQDRRRRGKSPVCPDCGSRGELVSGHVRHCDGCDVTFGWMVNKDVEARLALGQEGGAKAVDFAAVREAVADNLCNLSPRTWSELQRVELAEAITAGIFNHHKQLRGE